MSTGTQEQVVYMLDENQYGSSPYGPYIGAPDIDFDALKAEYRALRYAEEEAAGDDFCFVDGSGFAGWLVSRGILKGLDSVTVNIEIDTSGELAYVPKHWPLCPACEEGRGELVNGEVKHALNAVDRFRRCTRCGHEWDHRLEQWCHDKPMIPDDGRYVESGCVPYSLSQVSGVPMSRVLEICRPLGFREGYGMDTSKGLQAARELGLMVTKGHLPPAHLAAGKLTLRRLIDTLSPTKSYLVEVNGHWLAIVNGQNRDQADTSKRSEVRAFWEVSRVPAAAT